MALWLLEHLSPACSPLVGDLLEERHRGRSRGWLWQQVSVALVLRCLRDIRAHAPLGAVALLTGWLFVWVAGLADSVLILNYPGIRLSRLLVDLAPANSVQASLFYDAAFAGGLVFLAVASGWLVTVLYRPVGLSVVLLYCASFSLFGAYRMLVHATGWYSSEPALAQAPAWMSAPWSSFLMLKVALYFPLFSAGILLGGYLATLRRRGAKLARA